MNKALHPRDDVDRLYVLIKGGIGLVIIQDSIDASIQRLEDYIKKKCGGRLVTVTRNNTDNTSINRIKITGKQKWKEKQFYGHCKRQISEISCEKTWTWLRKRNLRRETESLLIATQNSAIRFMSKKK